MLVLELGHSERLDALVFAPDGGSLATPCNAGVYIWRTIAPGARAEKLLGPNYPRFARFTSDGRWLIAGAYELARLDPAGGPHVSWVLPSHYYVSFDVSPTEGLVVFSQSVLGAGNASRLTCWRTDDPAPAGKVWEHEFLDTNGFRPLFIPGGERIVRVEGRRIDGKPGTRCATYSAATGELLHTSALWSELAASACVSPDGRWIAGCDLSRVHLGSVEGGPHAGIKNDGRRHFTDVAFHPSGKYIATTSNDATVKLYDTTNWELAKTLTWKLGRMRSVAFSPDGTLAAAGSDKGQVIVWDVDV